MVMSPEELSFLYATKGGGPKQGMEGGYDWSALASLRGWIDSPAATRMFWQPPDKPHQSMRGYVQCVGVISVHSGQM